MRQLSLVLCLLMLLSACSTREIQNSLTGSTAQRLVTHSIDDLMRLLPDGRLDTTDSYTSQWIGEPSEKSPQTLGGTGAPVGADDQALAEVAQAAGEGAAGLEAAGSLLLQELRRDRGVGRFGRDRAAVVDQ